MSTGKGSHRKWRHPSGVTLTKPTSRPRSRKPSPDPRDYQIVVHWSADDGCYLAEAPALGCRTHGATPEEALRNGVEVVALWLEDAVAHGDPIPPPVSRRSGKLTLRIPASLHQELARRAERDRLSLNQWILTRLASAL
jgi:antitoxin HicB